MRFSTDPAAFLALCGTGLLALVAAVPLSGCATRASEGAYAPDSTVVYASARSSDVNATICFALKGSKKAEDAARRAKEERIAAKKRADEEKKAAERAKSGKKKPSKKHTSKEPAASDATRPAAKKAKEAVPRLVEDRVFEIEDGARVQATVTVSNRLARGERPLLVHMVWIKPNGRSTYKKLIEFDPTGPDSTLTGSISIPPDKRVPGTYTLRVFLFRELIAEKTFALTGTGGEIEEPDEEQM